MIQIVTTYHFLFSFTIFFFQHENLKNNKNPKISKRSPKIPIPNEGIKRKFHSFFSTSHCETERDRETYYRLSKDRKLEREEEDQTGGEKGKERRGEMVTYVNALLYGVGGIVVAGMALLVAFQEKLVYVPVLPGLTKSYQITPSRLRLTYEDVFLHASDGVRLHSWFIKLFPDCRGHRSLSLIRLLLVFVSESQGLVVVVAIYHIYIHIGVASLRFEFSSSNWSIRLLFFYFGIFMFGGILNFVQVSFSKSQVAVSLNQGFVVVRLQEFSVQSR